MHLLLHAGGLSGLLIFQVVHGEGPQHLRFIPNLTEQHCLLLPLPLLLPICYVLPQRINCFHLEVLSIHEISFSNALFSQTLGSCQHLA